MCFMRQLVGFSVEMVSPSYAKSTNCQYAARLALLKYGKDTCERYKSASFYYQQTEKIMVRCNVRGCKRSAKKDKEHHFFRTPQNPELRRKWQEFAEIEGSPSHFRICSDHFDAKCIRKKYPRPLLTPEAIPTIRLQDTKDITEKEILEFSQPISQEGCAHNNNDIVVNITKATGEEPAIIEIQTNNKIRVIIKGKKCYCQ